MAATGEEALRKLKEIQESADRICGMADGIYRALKEVQKLIVEKKTIECPDWHLLEALALRMFQNAAMIYSDARDIADGIAKLAMKLEQSARS